MPASFGSVYKRCGCRDQASSAPLGRRCPHLRQRGHGSWYLAVELSPGPSGQRQRFRQGGYRSRAAAQDALRQLARPVDTALSTAPLTTGAWLQRWLTDRQTLRPATRRNYAAHLRLYLLPWLGRIPLCLLTPTHVQAMFTGIAAEHAAAHRRWSPATATRLRATLRAALNAAIRRRLITSNAAREVELPVARRPHALIWTPSRVAAWKTTGTAPVVAVWTAEQTAQFLRHADADPLLLLYRLIALRGLRRGEAAGLTWPDIDLDQATVTVTQQLLEDGGKLTFGPPKSEASRRTIPLDHHTVTLLRRHHRAQVERLGNAAGLVFTRDDGRPIRPEYLTRHFQRLTRDAGLPPIRLHDLRHGAATLALAAGADLKTIQDLLGHSSIVLTADTYTSVLPVVARRVAEATARLVLAAARTAPGRPVGTITRRASDPLGHTSTPSKIGQPAPAP